jgi:hypothetical protein
MHWTEWMLTYREICRKAHKTPNPAPAPAAMRTRFGRLAVASINFRYFFGPNFQRCKCRLGNNAPIIPSPMIAIAAISLNLLPTIKPSLSFIEIDLLPTERSYRALFGESVRDQTDQAILHMAIRAQAGHRLL